MFLLAGLGNPGASYAKNRHNVGFLALDAFAGHYHFPPFISRHHGEAAKGHINGQDTLLLKPMTFMNRSGIAVAEAARFYKIPPARVWVVHDDLDLVPCKLRIKRGGGDGGHNGLKSIDAHLGKEYGRLRLGIGRPEHTSQVHDYVLGDPGADETPEWKKLFAALAESLPLLLEGRESLMMTQVARAMQMQAD